VLLVIVLAIFGLALHQSLQWADKTIGPLLNDLEHQGPP